MNPASTNTNPAFPATVAILSCFYNLLVVATCTFLPDDPLYIGRSISLYAAAGSVLSLLGLIGILTKRPTLIHPLAHFLLLDTLVSALTRLLILEFFLDSFSEPGLCSSTEFSSLPLWSPQNFSHDIVTSVRWQKESLWNFTQGEKRCRVAEDAVQVVLVGLLVCLTAAQGSLAMAMRRFGKEIEREREVVVEVAEMRVSARDPEKIVLEGL